MMKRAPRIAVLFGLTLLVGGCKQGTPVTGPDLPPWDFSGAILDAGPDLREPADLTVVIHDLAGADLAQRPDLSTPVDLAKPLDMTKPVDLSKPLDMTAATDLAPGTCTTNADCRLFSSYCDTTGCDCIALLNSAPDPTCTGGTIQCVPDPPCMFLVAVCDATGRCVTR